MSRVYELKSFGGLYLGEASLMRASSLKNIVRYLLAREQYNECRNENFSLDGWKANVQCVRKSIRTEIGFRRSNYFCFVRIISPNGEIVRSVEVHRPEAYVAFMVQDTVNGRKEDCENTTNIDDKMNYYRQCVDMYI